METCNYVAIIDCKTVVFGCFRKAQSAVSAILKCEAREGLSPFPLAVFSLAPDLSFEYGPVARVRKKYGCFAVYSYYYKWSFVKLSRNNA